MFSLKTIIKPNTFGLFLFFLVYWVNSNGQAITVSSISSETEIEGGSLIHEVTLTGTTTSTLAFSYSLVNNTVNFFDISGYGLMDGQYFDVNGQTLYVPPGHSRFRFRVDTLDDDIEEEDEFYTLTIDGVSATGTILDNDVDTTTVTSISNAEGIEGATLIHEIQFSNPLSVPKTFTFSFADNTTSPSDYYELTFSDNITYDETSGLIAVPIDYDGLTSFTITIRTFDDLIIEGDELYELTIESLSASGTILDNDLVTVVAVHDSGEVEGSDLVHHVVLNNINPEEKTFTFLITDVTTDGNDYGLPEFSRGVTYDPITQLISVPMGIRNFDVIIPTIDDIMVEDDEVYNLHIDSVTAMGSIFNNDTFNISKFFTPNNDNINETWPTDLLENSAIYTNAEIHIFNRYGILIKQIDPNNNGWDGTFNGSKMPADNYWYKITLENGTLLSGYFALKR